MRRTLLRSPNPPPPKFKPAVGVRQAHCSQEPPPFINGNQIYRGRRALGKSYEKRVHEHLGELYPGYVPGQWFKFTDGSSRERWCQPDGLIFDLELGGICVVEVKYQHTADAWWQLNELYMPVVRKAFPGWTVTMCEVVKWFDPAVVCPQRPRLCRMPDLAAVGDFGVFIWKP